MKFFMKWGNGHAVPLIVHLKCVKCARLALSKAWRPGKFLRKSLRAGLDAFVPFIRLLDTWSINFKIKQCEQIFSQRR